VGLSEAVRGELRDTPVEMTVVMPAFVNTELISGAEQPRAVKVAEPEDVANAITEALEFPTFDVHVPKSAGRIGWVMNMVPRRGREAIAHALKADQVLTNIDSAQRAAYEERISHAERSREHA
jgi:short-subunit dehydrogenase